MIDPKRETERRVAQCTFGLPLLRASACLAPRQAPGGRGRCSGAPKPMRAPSFCRRRSS